jgi:hypothetical protein
MGGLPIDFIARLDAATNVLLQAVVERSRSRGRRGGATTGLKNRLSAGRKTVRVLDALVKSVGANDPVLVADWNSIKRVQRPGGSRTASPSGVDPLPASPASTASAS